MPSAVRLRSTHRRHPVRGRRADGSLDRDLDSRIELEMRTDHKELSEHLMLVDLGAYDWARICTRAAAMSLI